jgi:HEAT repeat protein
MRRFYLLLFAVLMVIGVMVAVLTPSHEPSYGGKRLSEWLQSYETGLYANPPATAQAEEAAGAVRRIGTNAVPWVLKWIRPSSSPLMIKLRDSAGQVLKKVHAGWKLSSKADDRRRWAIWAFKILGPQAKGAVTELTRLLNQPNQPLRCDSANAAAFGLACIGEDAVPALVSALRSEQTVVRQRAVSHMELLGTNARPAVPVLLQCLRDRDRVVAWAAPRVLLACKIDPELLLRAATNCIQDSGHNVRVNFIDALGNSGQEGRPAVPLVLACLKDPDEVVAAHAARALGSLREPIRLVVPALTETLQDSRVSVRVGAARGLSEYINSKEARSAVPALLRALRDTDAGVREDATNALRNIDRGALEKVRDE